MIDLTVTEWVRLVLMVYAIGMMAWGVRVDCKERRFPNYILLNILFSGLLYSLCSGFIIEGIVGFILVNLIGVFLHKYQLMASGDMKFLSSLFLFISLRDWKTLLVLSAWMLIVMLFVGVSFYRRNGKNAKDDLKRQMQAYKALVLFRMNLFEKNEFETKEEMLEKTIPFTQPMFIAFLLTLATSGLLKAFL